MKGLKGGRAAGCSTGSFDTLKSLYFNAGEGTLIQLFDKVLNGDMHDASCQFLSVGRLIALRKPKR